MRLAQILRSAWSICRSSEPKGAASPNTSHWHAESACGAGAVPEYSGKLSAKRLMSVPLRLYSSTADVSRARASAVWLQTKNARSVPADVC